MKTIYRYSYQYGMAACQGVFFYKVESKRRKDLFFQLSGLSYGGCLANLHLSCLRLEILRFIQFEQGIERAVIYKRQLSYSYPY